MSERCTEKRGPECFAYFPMPEWQCGKCLALADTNFGGKACPFFKTQDQVNWEKQKIKDWIKDYRRGPKPDLTKYPGKGKW